MKPEDQDPTPEEQREAEALARALEGDASAAPPADVRATVGMLRHAGRGAALAPDRAAAVRARAAETLVRPARRRARWLWLAAPVAAAAAAVVLVMVVRRPPSPGALPLPAPSLPLLAAQAAAARGDARALDTLDQQMRAYRASMFRQLTGGAR